MKILIATIPAAGHVDPLTSVAAHLVARGHDVGWYIAPALAGRVEPLGVTVYPYRTAVAVTDENIAELFPDRARLRGPKRLEFDFDHVFAAPVAGHVADIRAIHDAFPFELLIGDAAFYAMSILGPTLGVTTYAVDPGNSLAPDPDVPPPFFGLAPMRGPIGALRDRIVWSMVLGSTRAGLVSMNAARAQSGLAPITPREIFTIPYDSLDRVFQVGVPETDFPRRVPLPNTRYVGALLPSAAVGRPSHLDPKIESWTGPVVAVSQGTIDNRDLGKLVEPTIEALAGSGALVVAVTGGIGTDGLRRRRAREDVVIEDYIAFGDLFPHTDVFVTNGGHGSAMLALAHRVPMVTAGTREGKNDVNARLERAGVARNLRTERPKPARIRAAVAAVLRDDGGIRRRIERVGAALDSYDPLAIIESAIAEDFPSRTRGGPGTTDVSGRFCPASIGIS